MKIRFIIAATTLALVTSAKPHGLYHRVHSHSPVQRDIVDAPVATETQIVYWLNDHAISEEEVREGIANGTLVLGLENILSTTPATAVAVFTSPPTFEDQPQPAGFTLESTPEDRTFDESFQAAVELIVEDPQFVPEDPAAEVPWDDVAPPDPPAIQPPDTVPNPWADLVDNNGYCAECGKEFPNGVIPCTKFPHGYGALPITHEGLGGWSGIQDPQHVGSDGFDDITTVVSGSCSDGTCCRPGSYCSYGCPSPYLKASFPSIQGKHGQTIGGLYCNKDGYLEMADGKIANTLCVEDSTHMKVKVQNNLSQTVSFCRTDYPGRSPCFTGEWTLTCIGTESMTFPVTVRPGQTGFLANPDQLRYFLWEGKKTSAQYYVNKAGVSESEACTWGKEMGGKGNWAPAVFGTSYDDGPAQQGFSSLKQNELCKDERLGYDITFIGEGVVSACRYKSSVNQWCEGDVCWEDPNRGCTAAIMHGDLTVVLSHGS